MEPSLPPVLGEEDRLCSAFSNILGHGIASLSKKEGAREINVIAGAKGGKVIIEFVDNGPGGGDPEKIFIPFYSSAASGTPDLGLCVSSSVIKKHKGRLWLDAAYQNGSRFVVELPVKEGVARDAGT
jgi:signal transduction histidine kinase